MNVRSYWKGGWSGDVVEIAGMGESALAERKNDDGAGGERAGQAQPAIKRSQLQTIWSIIQWL